jgi:hypothetical protein
MTNSQNIITKPMSKEDCVALCAKDNSCAAASFNKNSHICEMHDQIYSAINCTLLNKKQTIRTLCQINI